MDKQCVFNHTSECIQNKNLKANYSKQRFSPLVKVRRAIQSNIFFLKKIYLLINELIFLHSIVCKKDLYAQFCVYIFVCMNTKYTRLGALNG